MPATPLVWPVPTSLHRIFGGNLVSILVQNYARLRPSSAPSMFFTHRSCRDGPPIRAESKQIRGGAEAWRFSVPMA